MTFLRLCCLLAAILHCLPAAAGQPRGGAAPADGNRYRIVAYYFPAAAIRPALAPEDIDGRLLTHVNFAFANIRDGRVVAGDEAADTGPAGHIARLQALRRRHPHLKTLISVGGWNWSAHFSDAALDEASRRRFADSAADFARRHGFDGVDLDWEFPVAGGADGNVRRPEDKRNFTLLLRAVRDALDAAGRRDRRRYLLTIAAGNNATYIANTEMREVARIVDWVNVMTYDFHGPWSRYAGHNAPLRDDPTIGRAEADRRFNVASVVAMMREAGVPSRRLVLGMPFYGYSWTGCGTAQRGQFQDCRGKGRGSTEAGTLEFSWIHENLIDREGFVRHWNAAGQVPYLFHEATGEFVTYDDAQSIAAKARFVRDRRLGGAMFWHLGADRGTLLQRSLSRALRDR